MATPTEAQIRQALIDAAKKAAKEAKKKAKRKASTEAEQFKGSHRGF
jgi:hypothetical protein